MADVVLVPTEKGKPQYAVREQGVDVLVTESQEKALARVAEMEKQAQTLAELPDSLKNLIEVLAQDAVDAHLEQSNAAKVLGEGMLAYRRHLLSELRRSLARNVAAPGFPSPEKWARGEVDPKH
jgi:hypothetical protein